VPPGLKTFSLFFWRQTPNDLRISRSAELAMREERVGWMRLLARRDIWRIFALGTLHYK